MARHFGGRYRIDPVIDGREAERAGESERVALPNAPTSSTNAETVLSITQPSPKRLHDHRRQVEKKR